MGKYEEFRESIENLEKKLKMCNPEKDSAVILETKEKIAAVVLKMNYKTWELYYKECFIWMAKKTGVYFHGGAVAIEEVMSKVALEVWRLYDPKKGGLMPFIMDRTAQRAKDMLRSTSKILEHEVSLEGLAGENEEGSSQETAEQILSGQNQGEADNSPEQKIVLISEAEEAFYDAASNLIRFVSGPQNKRSTIRKLLWTANYSDDVFMAVLGERANFVHERDVFKAMNLKYINHCLDDSDAFSAIDKISAERLRKGKRRRLADMEWIPQNMEKPLVRAGDSIYYPPAGNKVYCGYLAQKENIVRSESTASVEHRRYLHWKKTLLGEGSY